MYKSIFLFLMLLQFYVVNRLIKHVTITTTAIFKLILSQLTLELCVLKIFTKHHSPLKLHPPQRKFH